jgi:hypothetical protein
MCKWIERDGVSRTAMNHFRTLGPFSGKSNFSCVEFSEFFAFVSFIVAIVLFARSDRIIVAQDLERFQRYSTELL